MKQRRKAILALLLSASVAASPIVSATSVLRKIWILQQLKKLRLHQKMRVLISQMTLFP